MAEYQSGDHVKVEFKDERTGESEWLWIKVDYCVDSDRLIFGWLDNESVLFPDKLRLGQHLAVNFDNVRGHRRE